MNNNLAVTIEDKQLAEVDGGLGFYKICILVALISPFGAVLGAGMALGCYMATK